MFENKVVDKIWKTELTDLTHGLYILLTTILQESKLETHNNISKRTFQFFLVVLLFLSHRFLFYYLFSNSCAQRIITSVIYILYRIL